MKYEQIEKIIFQEAKRAGYTVISRKSVTTNSIYYTIKNERCSLLFRISDHKTDANVVTLRTDLHLTEQKLIGFVRNRIKGLQRRSLDLILGL